jgi:hypothetical protein
MYPRTHLDASYQAELLRISPTRKTKSCPYITAGNWKRSETQNDQMSCAQRALNTRAFICFALMFRHTRKRRAGDGDCIWVNEIRRMPAGGYRER